MPRVIILSHVIFQQTPGLVGHHVALLWRGVTFGVRRDDEAGRQSLPGGEPLALGVVQTASAAPGQGQAGCATEMDFAT